MIFLYTLWYNKNRKIRQEGDMIAGVVIHTDGTRSDLKEVTLEALQAGCGGYVDAIRINNWATVFVNDDMFVLEPNIPATMIFGQPINGGVVVTGGVDEEGNTLPIPQVLYKRLAKVLAKRKGKK
jgi:hypothetical protein